MLPNNDEMSEAVLKLNPSTGCYEATFKIQIEEEIFRRKVFTYIEDNHINLTDLGSLQLIAELGRVKNWLSHPRTSISSVGICQDKSGKADTVPLEPISQTEYEFPGSKWLSNKDKNELIAKARQLPIDRWEELLIPIPNEGTKLDKHPIYQTRSLQRRALEQLKQELYPPSDVMGAIAEVFNGNRIK